jgi:CRP-like cAMP-binding protein
LTPDERAHLEAAVTEVRTFGARTTISSAGEELNRSLLLLEGMMARYIDDREGLRQLVAIHVPGDFVDLHSFPLKVLDHDVATLTAAQVAIVPHANLAKIDRKWPDMARKLWFSTLVDAAIHRAWLFRIGRLDGIGRVAHFICETNARLVSAGLSNGRSFDLPLTQADIAEICALTPVHVNRVLRALREEKICVMKSASVQIVDAQALVARAQFDPTYLYIDRPWPQA